MTKQIPTRDTDNVVGEHEDEIPIIGDHIVAASTSGDGWVDLRDGDFETDGVPTVHERGKHIAFANNSKVSGELHAWSGKRSTKSWSAPTAGAFDMAWDGTYMWLSDHNSDCYVYQLDRDGTVHGGFNTPINTGNQRGITYDGNSLWVAHYNNGYLYEFDRNGTVTGGFHTQGQDPYSLCWTGDLLVTNDYKSSTIYKYDRNGNAEGESPAPNGSLSSFGFDGEHIWASDKNDGRMLKLNLSGDTVDEVFDSTKMAYGVAWDGDGMWVIQKNDTIRRYGGNESATGTVLK